jgi:hypothetical protein
MARSVQFFTNEKWRAQSQTNRVATFVGVIKVPWIRLLLAVSADVLSCCPWRRVLLLGDQENAELEEHRRHYDTKGRGIGSSSDVSCDSQTMVDSFFAALPGSSLSPPA